MVARRRVNLSLAEGDYARLVEAAAAEGKLPATWAADAVKEALAQAVRGAQGRFAALAKGSGSLGGLKAPGGPVVASSKGHAAQKEGVVLTRQQRRALERAKSKGGR